MAEETDTTETTNLEQTETTETETSKVDSLDETSILGDVKSEAEKEVVDEGDKPADESKAEEGPALVGEVPEAYALKAPEGRSLDAEAVKLFEPIFKKLTLTNDGAQSLVDAAPAFVDHIAQQVQNGMTAQVVETRKAWATEAQNDKEIGGANFEQSKAACGRMFDKFGWADGGAFRTFLNETGLGSHPEMIRAMVKIAAATGEDSFERGESSKGEVPVWDRVYGAPSAQ
ncbi:MAG: hypothetical protein ACRCYS_04990 [Beijerinckiaceae bacterium]